MVIGAPVGTSSSFASRKFLPVSGPFTSSVSGVAEVLAAACALVFLRFFRVDIFGVMMGGAVVGKVKLSWDGEELDDEAGDSLIVYLSSFYVGIMYIVLG